MPTSDRYGIVDVNYRSAQNTTITLDPLANIAGYALTNLRIGAVLKPYNIDAHFRSVWHRRRELPLRTEHDDHAGSARQYRWICADQSPDWRRSETLQYRCPIPIGMASST